jgi:hypothetical protein
MLTPQEERRAADERRQYWDQRLNDIPEGDDEALAKYHADWDAEQNEEWARDQDQKEVFGIVIILFAVTSIAIVNSCL